MIGHFQKVIFVFDFVMYLLNNMNEDTYKEAIK